MPRAFLLSALFGSLTLLYACELERAGSLAVPDAGPVGVGGVAGSEGIAGAAAVAGRGASSGASAFGGSGGTADGGGGIAGAGGASGSGGSPIWTPSDIADCQVWLDAADAFSIQLSGANVTSWQDKCGNSAATASGPQAPVLGIVAGKSAVRCDGIDDRLSWQAPGNVAVEYSLFFVVGKNFTLADQRPIWSNRNESAAPGGTVTYVGFYNRAYVYQNTAVPTLLQGDTFYAGTPFTTIYEVMVTDTGRREVLLDGKLEGMDPSGTGMATTLGVGTLCADLPNSQYAAYDLHEIVGYSRALSDAERQTVRNELSNKWGL